MSAARAGNSKSVFHLIHGTDEFQVAAEARRLVDQLCPPAEQAFGLESLDGSVETMDAVAMVLARALEALQTVGFFGSGKVIWLRDAFFLGDLKLMANKEVKARLTELTEELARGLLEGQRLVISAGPVDRRTAFFKSCQELATVREFSLPEKPREADQAAQEFCAERLEAEGLRARGDALAAFLNRSGGDRRLIVSEIEKLALYLGERREFTTDDVRAIISPARELPVWDLLDEFGGRKLGAALGTLRQLLFQKEAPIGMIIMLEGRIRDLLIFKDCLQRRWLSVSRGYANWAASAEADAALMALGTDPRKKHPFVAGKLAEQAAQFSMAELRMCHRQLLDAHELMVSSPVPPELLLELVLIRCLGGRDAPAG